MFFTSSASIRLGPNHIPGAEGRHRPAPRPTPEPPLRRPPRGHARPVFQSGNPRVVDQPVELQNQRPDLFILWAAAAIKDQFGYWEQELLKSSPSVHAIIHDKLVVIDPFSPECAVTTGSRNLGYRASYNNDRNLLIIRGNRALAEAYAAHVINI